MAKDIKVYDLLISCPSDVSEYVEMLEKEVFRIWKSATGIIK